MDATRRENERNAYMQHIPAFVDTDRRPEWVEFDTLGELMNTPLVKRWMKPTDGVRPFPHLVQSTGGGAPRLMVTSERGYEWWVLAYLRYPVAGLPEWDGGRYRCLDGDRLVEIDRETFRSVCGDRLTTKDGRVLRVVRCEE